MAWSFGGIRARAKLKFRGAALSVPLFLLHLQPSSRDDIVIAREQYKLAGGGSVYERKRLNNAFSIRMRHFGPFGIRQRRFETSGPCVISVLGHQ